MKTHTTLLLSASLLPSFAAAQATKVVPPNYTKVESTGQSFFPYIYNAGRTQQIWEGATLCAQTAVINKFSFRRDGGTQPLTGQTFASMTVSIGTTPMSPTTMSSTFATNVKGVAMTKILDKKAFSVPAQVATPTNQPGPFNITHPLSAPFIFMRTKGHLIVDWLVPGQASSKNGYALDGATFSSGTGYTQNFGKWGTFSAGDTPSFSATASTLLPNGSVDLFVNGLKSQYTAFVFFGLSRTSWGGIPLPLDLALIGAPGNKLRTGREIEIPLPVTAAKIGFTGQVKVPIPNDPNLAGYTVYAQSWYMDAKANSLGAVTSDNIGLTVGTGKAFTRVLFTSDSSSLVGSYDGRGYQGAVTEFAGSIL